MGSQSKRKKGTKDTRNTTTDIKRQIDQDASRTALEPRFEIGYSPAGVIVPEFVRVDDRIDWSTQTRTAPFNTTTLNLWLKLNGNYQDYSNEQNDVYAHVFQRNRAFMAPGKFGSHAALLNYPSFVAPGDQIIIPDATPTQLDFSTGFSYSFWFYPKTFNSSYDPFYQTLLCKRLDNSNLAQIYFTPNTGPVVECLVTEGGTTVKRKSSTNATFNAWNHCVLTYNGSAVEIYLNKVAGVVSTAGPFLQTTTDLCIGNLGGSTTGGVCFKGGIDELMYVKAQVLNQTNVNNLFDNNVF